jgi:hypothetical protein
MRLPTVIVVAVLLASCGGSSDKSPETEPRQGGVYHDPAGWSAHVPAGWVVLPFETSKGDASAAGTQISNVELPAPEIEPGLPIQTSGLVLPPDGVSLVIAADTDPRNVQVPPPSPLSPPLSLADFDEGSTTGGGPTLSLLWLEVGGNVLLASIRTGPTADEADLAALVASIRESD